MKESLKIKLMTLANRYRELGAMLSDAAIISNQDRFRTYSKEYAQIEPIVQCFEKYQYTLESIAAATAARTERHVGKGTCHRRTE